MAEPLIPTLGVLLRAAREARGLTRAQAADAMRQQRYRLSARTLSYFEQGVRRPPLTLFVPLLQLYRVEPDLLVGAWLLTPRQRPS